MNRKMIIGISAAAILLIAAVLIALLLNGTGKAPEPTEPMAESTEAPLPPTTEAAAPSEAETEPEETQPEATRPAPTETEAPETKPTEQLPTHASFPYLIPGTDLVIEGVKSYDGIFLEDGSDREITGVAAVVLKNIGNRCVDFARISMEGQKTDLRFEASGIGAGASVVVMEADMAKATEQEYGKIHADVAMTDSLEMSEGRLIVEETEDGKLCVTNLTETDIPCVRVFYKFYLEEAAVFVGGITYTVKLEDLKAGQSVMVTPSHYVAGSSKVIMAKTYESSQN